VQLRRLCSHKQAQQSVRVISQRETANPQRTNISPTGFSPNSQQKGISRTRTNINPTNLREEFNTRQHQANQRQIQSIGHQNLANIHKSQFAPINLGNQTNKYEKFYDKALCGLHFSRFSGEIFTAI